MRDQPGGGAAAQSTQLATAAHRPLRVLHQRRERRPRRGRYDSLSTPKERHVAAIESDGGVERPVGFGVTVYRVGADKSHSARTAFAASRLEAIAPLLAGLGASRIDTTGGGTDIGPLMKRGIPGIAHETVMEHYFDWHHTAADMLDKVDPVELRKNVAAMAVMIYARSPRCRARCSMERPAKTRADRSPSPRNPEPAHDRRSPGPHRSASVNGERAALGALRCARTPESSLYLNRTTRRVIVSPLVS